MKFPHPTAQITHLSKATRTIWKKADPYQVTTLKNSPVFPAQRLESYDWDDVSMERFPVTAESRATKDAPSWEPLV